MLFGDFNVISSCFLLAFSETKMAVAQTYSEYFYLLTWSSIWPWVKKDRVPKKAHIIGKFGKQKSTTCGEP